MDARTMREMVNFNIEANERNGVIADKARKRTKQHKSLGTSLEDVVIKSAQRKRRAIQLFIKSEKERVSK